MERVMEARNQQRRTGNCADHGHPDCYEPICVVIAQARKMNDELKILRAEIDTATEEPLLVLKSLKNTEKERGDVWLLVDALKEVLKQTEWAKDQHGELCLVCFSRRMDGHKNECDLDRALKGTLPIQSATEKE